MIFSAEQINFTIKIITLIVLMNFIKPGSPKAQSFSEVIGEYSLKGMPEMAAGFKFNEDSTFQFFYIYGAADRSAPAIERAESRSAGCPGVGRRGVHRPVLAPLRELASIA